MQYLYVSYHLGDREFQAWVYDSLEEAIEAGLHDAKMSSEYEASHNQRAFLNEVEEKYLNGYSFVSDGYASSVVPALQSTAKRN